MTSWLSIKIYQAMLLYGNVVMRSVMRLEYTTPRMTSQVRHSGLVQHVLGSHGGTERHGIYGGHVLFASACSKSGSLCLDSHQSETHASPRTGELRWEKPDDSVSHISLALISKSQIRLPMAEMYGWNLCKPKHSR